MKLSTSEAIHGKDLEIFESDFELRRITVERQSWNAIIWSICPTSLRSNDFHFCALPVSLESQEKSQRGIRDFFFLIFLQARQQAKWREIDESGYQVAHWAKPRDSPRGLLQTADATIFFSEDDTVLYGHVTRIAY